MTKPYDWRDEAACADHKYVPANYWVAEPDSRADDDSIRDQRTLAAQVCHTCPVRIQCAGQAELERQHPLRFGDRILRPFGVHAGRFYDGTARPPQDIPGTRERAVARMFAEGLDDNTISSRLHITVDAVRWTRRRIGAKRRQGGGPRVAA